MQSRINYDNRLQQTDREGTLAKLQKARNFVQNRQKETMAVVKETMLSRI